jgi:hypothetical protein
MKTIRCLVLLIAALLAGLSACSPSLIPTTLPTQDPALATAALQTRVAEIVGLTQAAQTLQAGQTDSIIAGQTDIANGVAGTLTALVTNTPEFTFTTTWTPSRTPTVTRTASQTPNFVRVTVGTDTNCRSGPSTAYPILGLVKAGQTAEIVGQDAQRGHFVIRLPSDPTVICWIWKNSATVVGDSNPVPIFTPQPTPTETLDFGLAYAGFTSCGGAYMVLFKITNTSDLTWESNQVNATDRSLNITTTINRDRFTNYDGCTLVGNDGNLAPGEVGVTASNTFANNPSGHDFKALLQLCTNDSQSGTCITKTITFTP